jgi:hypothetical protein
VIKYQKWSEVPYTCKDGRVLTNHDFMPAEIEIDGFIQAFDEQLLEFLPHHNRAKFLDNDWKLFFDNVSRVDEKLQSDPNYDVNRWWELPRE